MNRSQKLVFKALAIVAYTALTVGSVLAQKRTAAAPPVHGSTQLGVPNSVILQNADAQNNVKRLHVLHAYALGDLHRQPVLKFSGRQVDMTPFLNNPRAVPNMAAKLQAAPRYVKVLNSSSTASEVDQGVVVESDLQFTFANGACGDASARAAIDAIGVHCPMRTAPPSSKGASNLDAMVPMSHSTANTGSIYRAQYAAYYKQQDAQLTQHIAALRAALKDPTKRAKLVASVGQDKVDQIAALTDDQIKDNIASTVVQHVHETIFVPKTAMTKLPAALNDLGSQPAKPNLAAPVAKNSSADQTTNQPLGPDIYLTGFTLGNQYEWSMTISFDIDPCMLGLDVLSDGLASVVSSIFGVSGCPFHASLTPYAGLSIGFGMRFPIKTSMQYTRQITSKKSSANVRVDFAPYQATASEFTAKNGPALDQGKLFGGKEFVAEFQATAGINYDLPILGNKNLSVTFPFPPLPSFDLTGMLPSPFTNGYFTPPAANQSLNSAPIPITAIDLFGNLFDLGVLQATLNPAVTVGLKSNGLSFDLVDRKNHKAPTDPSGGHITHLTQSGTTVPLTVDPSDHSTDFLLTNPYYTVGLLITPGLVLHLGVDFGVWSDSWDPSVMIPQLAIEVPSNGINFACHDGTICTHEYQQLAGQAKAGEITQAEVIKNIQAQHCDGPTNDAHAFLCRSVDAYQYCNKNLEMLPKGWSCKRADPDALQYLFTTLDCPAGYCKYETWSQRPGPIQMTTGTGLPNDFPTVGYVTDACTTEMRNLQMQTFGYDHCCLDPSYGAKAKGCVTGGKAPPQTPVLHGTTGTTGSPTAPPSHNAPPSSQPNPPQRGATSTTPVTQTRVPSTPAPAHIPQSGTPAPPKPAGSTPPPQQPKPTPAPPAKPGSNTKTVPKTGL